MSRSGVAKENSSLKWSPGLFGTMQNQLPGQGLPLHLFQDVTYPRFLSMGDDLLFSYRIGK